MLISKKAWASSLKDEGFQILVVSNFTLYGHCKKGTKPDFHNSMGAEGARELYMHFVEECKKHIGEDKV